MSYTPDQLHNAIEAGFSHGDSELSAVVRLARRLARLSPASPDTDATRRMRLRFEAVMAGETAHGAAWWWPFGGADWRRPSFAQRFAAGALMLTALGGTASAVTGVTPAEAARGAVRVVAGAVQNLQPHTFLQEAGLEEPPQVLNDTGPASSTPAAPAAHAPGVESSPPGEPNGDPSVVPSIPGAAPDGSPSPQASPTPTATQTSGASKTPTPPPPPFQGGALPTATPAPATPAAPSPTPTNPPAMNPTRAPSTPTPTVPAPTPSPTPSPSPTPTGTPSPTPTKAPHDDDDGPEHTETPETPEPPEVHA